MKKVLIISPHFPPVNAPDMQRVRMSLPYFREFDWDVEVLAVDEKFVDANKDYNLVDSIPVDIKIHHSKAFRNIFTKTLGIRNVSLRSFWHLYRKGNKILSGGRFDLIFFSTSNFFACTLGPLWKKKFNIPYILDFQDPWHNVLNNGSSFSRKSIVNMLHRKLEQRSVNHSNGIISVSPGYVRDLKSKYNGAVKNSEIINFGSAEFDFEILKNKYIKPFPLKQGKINVVYTGALTPYFIPVIRSFFKVLQDQQKINLYHFYFIGTSYFDTKKGLLSDLINELNLNDQVTEYPNRISYFESLATMEAADIIFLPGSTDHDYNPSKVCNAILTGTPIFSIFNERSIVHDLISQSNAGVTVKLQNRDNEEKIYIKINNKIEEFFKLNKELHDVKQEALKKYSARELTYSITQFFNKVIIAE